MKKPILMAVTIFIVAVTMMGTASAQGIGGGCPNVNNFDSYTYLIASKNTNGNVVTYILNTLSGAPADAKVIGYCVYPTPVFTGSDSDLTPLALSAIWHPDNKSYFGFERGTGGNEIPIDGTMDIAVGETDYLSADKIPTSEVILFHIYDPKECGSDDTCWRQSGSPPPPVPELSQIILVSAGLLGIALISRKYRRN